MDNFLNDLQGFGSFLVDPALCPRLCKLISKRSLSLEVWKLFLDPLLSSIVIHSLQPIGFQNR